MNRRTEVTRSNGIDEVSYSFSNKDWFFIYYRKNPNGCIAVRHGGIFKAARGAESLLRMNYK